MKKILALSLTFAMASTIGICCNTMNIDGQQALRQEIDSLHMLATEMDCGAEGCNTTLTFDRGVTLMSDNGGYVLSTEDLAYTPATTDIKPEAGAARPNNSVATPRSADGASTYDVPANRVDNGYARKPVTNNNAVNSINSANSGTSPYGIGNANSGVLPNANNGNKVVNGSSNIDTYNKSNLDSMVRTNNIDTYKNNQNTNADGTIYNNNGAVVGNLNNTNNVANNTATNINGTNTNTANTNSTTNNGVNNINTRPSNTNGTTTTNNSTTIDRANSTSPQYTKDNKTNPYNKTTLSTQNTTNNTTQVDYTDLERNIDELNSKLSTLNTTLDQGIDTARANIQRVIDGEVVLSAEQAAKVNGYSRLLRKMTHKLTENKFELMHCAGEIAFSRSDSQSKARDLSPVYLDMQYTLTCREHCINCAIQALDAINQVFSSIPTDSTTTDTDNNGQNSSTTNSGNTSSGTTVNTDTTNSNSSTSTPSTQGNSTITNPNATVESNQNVDKVADTDKGQTVNNGSSAQNYNTTADSSNKVPTKLNSVDKQNSTNVSKSNPLV